jgi:DNA-binding transcriptional regulator GbsR (MarR family)
MVHVTPAMQKFILHWGEMGTAWGTNRSVAQVHALLYVSASALNAEEIAGALEMARSNVSTSLRELQSWGIIRVVHKVGDRRDHFESLADVWELFSRVLDERRKREIEPTIRLLQECVELAGESPKENPEVRKRLGAMLEFMKTADGWYAQMRRLPREAVLGLFKMGGKFRKLVGLPTGGE